MWAIRASEFESIRPGNDLVFYDDLTVSVFICRSFGEGGLRILTLEGDGAVTNRNFSLSKNEEVVSLLLNPQKCILGLQKTFGIDFYHLVGKNNLCLKPFQSFQTKSSKIDGFFWYGNFEIGVVTNKAIELIKIDQNFKGFKSLKSIPMNTLNWFMWSYEAGLFLGTTGQLSNQMLSVTLKEGVAPSRPVKFEIEPSISSNGPEILDESFVKVLKIYGETYVSAIREFTRMVGTKEREINLYHFKNNCFTKRHVLKLKHPNQKVHLIVVDNLIIVIYSGIGAVAVYDITIPSDDDGFLKSHTAIFDYVPSCKEAFDLTAGDWFPCLPNVLVSSTRGLVYYLDINLADVPRSSFASHAQYFTFLLHRKGSKAQILNSLETELVVNPTPQNMTFMSDFLKLCVFHQSSQTTEQPPVLKHSALVLHKPERFGENLPAQEDLVPRVFEAAICLQKTQPIVSTNSKNVLIDFESSPVSTTAPSSCLTETGPSRDMVAFITGILMSYMSSLFNYNVAIRDSTIDYLSELLCETRQLFVLHQLLQTNSIPDSFRFAVQLLSFSQIYDYPPFLNQALDMLTRSSSHQDIVEILITRGFVLAAAKHAKHVNLLGRLDCRKFLDGAIEKNDPTLFHSLFSYFTTLPKQSEHLKTPKYLEFLRKSTTSLQTSNRTSSNSIL